MSVEGDDMMGWPSWIRSLIPHNQVFSQSRVNFQPYLTYIGIYPSVDGTPPQFWPTRLANSGKKHNVRGRE